MAKQQLDVNANNRNLTTSSLEGLFSSGVTENAPTVTETRPLSKNTKATVRQTFVFDASDMGYILDLVYTRIIEKGAYTQKEALLELIRFHRDNHSDIKTRPNK